jgi:hypothetical protein
MDLQRHIEDLQRQLAIAAEAGGDEARELGARLIAPLDAAVRLTLLEVLAAAAEEITTELAPGSVELRLRGRDPEFVVSLAPADDDESSPVGPPAAAPAEADGGALSRINVRMPDNLKARIERAAAGEGLSVNAWLVRAAAAGLERADTDGPRPRAPHGGQRFTGWGR